MERDFLAAKKIEETEIFTSKVPLLEGEGFRVRTMHYTHTNLA
jgi:hypothetical protein